MLKQYGICRSTLSKWASQGKIRAIRVGTGPRAAHRYHEGDLHVLLGVPEPSQTADEGRIFVLYARVSSPKQKEAGDLQRQIELLQQHYPDHDLVIKDVGSGLNFHRKGLSKLLELVEAGRVCAVAVSYKDRLARFGVDLIERTLRRHGAALHVVSHLQDTHDEQGELAEDLLAVYNFFVARNNGRRAAALRRGRQARGAASIQHDAPEEASQGPREETPSDSDNDDQEQEGQGVDVSENTEAQCPRAKRGRRQGH